MVNAKDAAEAAKTTAQVIKKGKEFFLKVAAVLSLVTGFGGDGFGGKVDMVGWLEQILTTKEVSGFFKKLTELDEDEISILLKFIKHYFPITNVGLVNKGINHQLSGFQAYITNDPDGVKLLRKLVVIIKSETNLRKGFALGQEYLANNRIPFDGKLDETIAGRMKAVKKSVIEKRAKSGFLMRVMQLMRPKLG